MPDSGRSWCPLGYRMCCYAGLMLLCLGPANATAQPTSAPTSAPSAANREEVIEIVRTAVQHAGEVDWYNDIVLLESLPLDVVVAALGEPATQVEFTMADCCDEFRIELLNTYPDSDPSTRDRQIRELTWNVDGYHLTVWAHQTSGIWTVLDTCFYAEGTEF